MAAGARDEGRGRLAPARPPARRVPSLPPHRPRGRHPRPRKLRPVSASLGTTRPIGAAALRWVSAARPASSAVRTRPTRRIGPRRAPRGACSSRSRLAQAPRGARSSGAPEQATRTPTRTPTRGPSPNTGAAGRAPTIVILTSVRSLVLSDVHAEQGALERVLDDTAGRWDRLLLLGDLIGYGDAPVAVVRRLREVRPVAAVRGNHEAMLGELLAGRRPRAAEAIVATLKVHADALDGADLAWLLDLPERTVAAPAADGDAGVALAHGHPDPARPFDYLLGVPAARRAAEHMARPITFVGHTHVPGGFLEVEGRWRPVPARKAETVVSVPSGARAFLNPGSVAAARDGGPGACYLLFDHDKREATFVRLGSG